MDKLRHITSILPEYILLIAVIVFWISTKTILNPFAIGLVLIITFQIIYKNKIIGIVIPSILILISLYMLLALLSEFNEFPTFSYEAKKLLFVGLSIFVGTILIALLMVYNTVKFSKK